MKRVGIIGGIGPISTIDYYRGIIDGYRTKVNNGNYPELTINSVNMTEMLSFLTNEDWDALVKYMLKAIEYLAGAGAEFAAMASNTPHIVFDRIQQKSALPLVSIVDHLWKAFHSASYEK